MAPSTFEIVHQTTYRFARPVTLHPHRLMLRPRDSHDLRVLDFQLTCAPAADLVWSQDVSGNLCAVASFPEAAQTLVIESRLTVASQARAWPVFPISPAAQTYPFAYGEDEATDLGALRWPAPDPEVARWAHGFVAGPQTDTLSLLKDLNAGILGAAAYRVRDEEGVQSAGETLRLASGSCRDLAALFIEAARQLGFGARAVSGYLFDPDQMDRQADTTHAWAEVYLPGAGWITFDPTHNRIGAAGLIPLAVGRANGQIMPVVGSFAGSAHDAPAMEISVRITPVG
ncbi:MAG: transglutaminase family protein [Phenylobacterium sp.]|uniref:transglutaminase family protein n=1 Tax=Phenylobacterium sp. TaxID=1871053 RepID=UPI00273277D1|nr:transglutaminase family protein [Phenylobacterium sp.]MDP1641873.1 transglutaminase family protein [Phenylobacterium sp.]MDP3118207.1 transglutaminase family protein [Phenylobacterium sp.]